MPVKNEFTFQFQSISRKILDLLDLFFSFSMNYVTLHLIIFLTLCERKKQTNIYRYDLECLENVFLQVNLKGEFDM